MTDTNEPSYYEVALTNRQVLVSFVVLLGCILTAFVFGVWVGKEGSDPAVDSIVASSDPADMAQLDDRSGFDAGSGGASDEGANPPDLTELLNGSKDTTLAQDIGSAPRDPAPSQAEPPRQSSPPSSPQASPPPPAQAEPAIPPPPRQASPRQAPPRQAPPRQASPSQAPPSAAAAQEGFIVQVFSSHDQVQANKILQQMKQGGYRAFLSPLRRDGSSQVMYRVRLGPYAERAPADSAAKDIRSQYKLETWVTAASN